MTNSVRTTIAHNLKSVRRRIDAACDRSGRSPHDVTLVAVTKYADPAWIPYLLDEGVVNLGESRPQQLEERANPSNVNAPKIRWHLIGHLQRNKVRRVLPLVELIHSVDSLRLLNTIERIANEDGLRPRVLLEVNVSGEQAKHGFTESEVAENLNAIFNVNNVEVCGLMTMAPHVENEEDARPVFRRLRELRDELRDRTGRELPVLSMGMSGDFEIAVEEGATLVRVGSVLYEGLEYSL